ncbi:unnamed protein product [Moneuplotes crassus]|uniref:Uncharacterized protein n=1 Tax=Euplotes crassus TaxID=5936 RepID=A0AAD1U1B8_EUPCR|nr:unnamed protein product [Moneuplotes crassus]
MYQCTKPKDFIRNTIVNNSMTTRGNSVIDEYLNNPVANNLIYRSVKSIDTKAQVQSGKKPRSSLEYTCNIPDKKFDTRKMRIKSKFKRNLHKNKFKALNSSQYKSSSEMRHSTISQEIFIKDLTKREEGCFRKSEERYNSNGRVFLYPPQSKPSMEISGTNPSADLDIVRPDRFKSSQNTSPNGSPKLQNSHLPFDLTKTSLSHHKFSIPLSSQPCRGLLKRLKNDEIPAMIAKNIKSLMMKLKHDPSKPSCFSQAKKSTVGTKNRDQSWGKESLVCVNFPLISKISAQKRYRRTKRDNQNLSLDPAALDRKESKRLDGRGKDMYNQYRAKREKFIKIKENIYQEPHVNSDQAQKGHFQAVKLKHSEICSNTRYSNEKYGDSSFAAYNFRSVLP